jgi:hypothetical protein
MSEIPNKADTAAAHREAYLARVRAGEMTPEQYLREICGVPEAKLVEMMAKLEI